MKELCHWPTCRFSEKIFSKGWSRSLLSSRQTGQTTEAPGTKSEDGNAAEEPFLERKRGKGRGTQSGDFLDVVQFLEYPADCNRNNLKWVDVCGKLGKNSKVWG